MHYTWYMEKHQDEKKEKETGGHNIIILELCHVLNIILIPYIFFFFLPEIESVFQEIFPPMAIVLR